MGCTAVQNTVCLSLLEFCPPAINPEFVMECTLTAHPIWWMYSKKLFGINTLSWSVGSMGLPPGWPWRARRWRISCPDESVQCWNLFWLPPSPAILLFHTSSDQYWEFSNSIRRSSLNLQNSIAPSSSRSNCPCRRRVFSLFATGYAWLDWAPGSISIHILSRICIVLEDEYVVEDLLGFALPFDRLVKASTSVFNANASVFLSEVSCSLSSNSVSIKSVTYLFNPWEILTHEWELSLLQIQFPFPLHIYLASNWLWLLTRAQLWCSLESNLSGQLNFHLVAKCAHDMSLVLQIVRTRQCVLSWSIVRFQLFSGILHQYKSFSLDLVVRAFPLVPCASATNVLVQGFQSKV